MGDDDNPHGDGRGRDRKETYYRAILNHLHDEIVVIDPTGRITDANEVPLSVTGHRREALIGRNFTDIFNEFTAPGGGEVDIARVFASGEPGAPGVDIGHVFASGEPFRGRLERSDGPDAKTVLEVFISPIRGRNQEITHAVVAVRNVTREVMLQERIQLGNKIQAVGTLAGGIAHEFNNLLMSILLNIESVLRFYRDDAFVRESLGIAYKASLQARDLVGQLLVFGRQTRKTREPLHLTPLVKETVRLFCGTLPETVEFAQTIAAGPDRVSAAPEEIHQILVNLMTNAVDAMKDGGGRLGVGLDAVTLGSDADLVRPGLAGGSYVRLTVSDTGHGISPGDLDQIFDPFFTRNRAGERAGMGLSITHGIVSGLNGAVTVKSAPGKGAEFRVYLPAVEHREPAAWEPERTRADGSGSILLVDDNRLILNTLTTILTRHGYRVCAVAGGPEALALFTADPDRFDLLITDLVMPDMDGLSLTREVLAVRTRLPVILLSGAGAAVEPGNPEQWGVRAVVRKPVLFSEFHQTIRHVLGSSATGPPPRQGDNR